MRTPSPCSAREPMATSAPAVRAASRRSISAVGGQAEQAQFVELRGETIDERTGVVEAAVVDDDHLDGPAPSAPAEIRDRVAQGRLEPRFFVERGNDDREIERRSHGRAGRGNHGATPWGARKAVRMPALTSAPSNGRSRAVAPSPQTF